MASSRGLNNKTPIPTTPKVAGISNKGEEAIPGAASP